MHRKGQTIYLTQTEREHVFFMVRPDGCFPNDVAAFNAMLDDAIGAYLSQHDPYNLQLGRALLGLASVLRRPGSALADANATSIQLFLSDTATNASGRSLNACDGIDKSINDQAQRNASRRHADRQATDEDLGDDEEFWQAEILHANVAVIDAEMRHRHIHNLRDV